MKTKINKLLSLIALVSVCVTGCEKNEMSVPDSNGPETAMTKVMENVKDVPVDGTFFNECCGEDVYISGTAHVVFTDNIIHLVARDFTGTGLSTGYNYIQQGAAPYTNVFYSNQFVGILTFTLIMTNTNGCSFRLKYTFQTHLNANGDVTADFQNVTTMCL